MGRPKRLNLQAMIDAHMRGDKEAAKEFPERAMEYVAAICNKAKKDSGMAREVNLRWQGMPERTPPVDLPPTTIVVQQVRALPAAGETSGAGTAEGTTCPVPDSSALPSADPVDARIEAPQPRKPRYMPVIEEPEVVRLPAREDALDEDEEEDDDQ